jgi:hypothetical protein
VNHTIAALSHERSGQAIWIAETSPRLRKPAALTLGTELKSVRGGMGVGPTAFGRRRWGAAGRGVGRNDSRDRGFEALRPEAGPARDCAPADPSHQIRQVYQSSGTSTGWVPRARGSWPCGCNRDSKTTTRTLARPSPPEKLCFSRGFRLYYRPKSRRCRRRSE